MNRPVAQTELVTEKNGVKGLDLGCILMLGLSVC